MGLLQIGGGAKEKCGGLVAGIDLGTTYSLVSVVQDGSPVVLGDEQGRITLPSVVWFGEGQVVEVGYEARARASERAAGTIASAKRFMGRSQSEAQALDELHTFQFSSDKEGPVVYFDVGGGRSVTPMEVGARILQTLAARAEASLGGALDGVVITVPAYFDDAQRQATKDAARMAGLTVLRLLNEPTAAALAYGLEQRSEGMFAVFDMGGGTFDISVLRLEDGVFQVLATGGDSRLGGDDFDQAIAEYLLRALEIDRAQAQSTEASSALLASARWAKEALTENEQVEVEVLGGKVSLSRTELETLIAPVLKRCNKPIRQVLADVGIDGDELDGVVLVGGSTRTPAVRSYVGRMFGQEPLSDLDPDMVVAMGAAVQADMLGGTGPRDDVLLLDVLPLSLGVETMGGVVEKILHRNQAIPAKAAQEFTTYADGQTGMVIHILQGEREMVEDTRSLGRFTLSGIPPLGAGMAKVQVTFSVDADGLLDVSAEETESGTKASVEVKPSYGLDDETVERMILDSFAFAEEDVARRVLAEALTESSRILSALEVALSADGQLLESEERTAIEAAQQDLRDAVSARNAVRITACIERLDKASAEFAGRRMNRSIHEALAGRSAMDAV